MSTRSSGVLGATPPARALLAVSLLFPGASVVAQQPVTLNVHFALVLPHNTPVSGVPVRLVVGEHPAGKTRPRAHDSQRSGTFVRHPEPVRNAV